MTEIQQSTSFRGPPERVWTYVTNVEGWRFQPPTIVMIANILREMSRPDQDVTMVILTELIQSELGVEGQLRALYAHVVSMAQTAREHESAISNLSQRFNKSLVNPSTEPTPSLATTVARLEALIDVLKIEKKEMIAKIDRQGALRRKAI